MAYTTEAYKPNTYPSGLRGGWASSTASAAVVLTKLSSQNQKIDPGGAHRDVTLPGVADDMNGYWFKIANAANAAENLTVKDAAGNTIGTVNQSETGEFYVDADGVWQLFQIVTSTYV